MHSINDLPPATLPDVDQRLISALEALDRFKTPISVADTHEPDCPLVYVNDHFCALTGYTRDQVLGRNCRFLQCSNTNRASVLLLHNAVYDRKRIEICLRNQTAEGEQFDNFLTLAPFKMGGDHQYMIGFQYDLNLDRHGNAVREHLERTDGVVNALDPSAFRTWNTRLVSYQMRAQASEQMIRAYLQQRA